MTGIYNPNLRLNRMESFGMLVALLKQSFVHVASLFGICCRIGGYFRYIFPAAHQYVIFGLAPLMSVAMLCRVVLGEPGYAHAGH